MDQGSTCLASSKIVHFLPGRVRIELAGLRGAKSFSGQLVERLIETEGIEMVRANPLTGRLLVNYNRGKYSEAKILEMVCGYWQVVQQNLEQAAPEAGGPSLEEQKDSFHNQKRRNGFLYPLAVFAKPLAGFVRKEEISFRHQFFNTILGTGVLAFLGLKHLVWGKLPLARSTGLFNIAAFTTIVSGYPLLSRGVRSITAGGPVNSDLVMSVVGLTTVILRESMLGLSVTLMANITSLANVIVREEYKKQMLDVENPAGEETSNLGRELLAEMGQVIHEAGESTARSNISDLSCPENISRTYFGLSFLTGIATGDWKGGLSMALASCPGPSGLVAPLARAAGSWRALRKGIYLKDPAVLQTLNGVDTVLFCESGIFSAPVRVGEVISTGKFSTENILDIASALTAGTGHHLSGVLKKASTINIKEKIFQNVKITLNRADGIRGIVDNRQVEVGNAAFVGDLSQNGLAILLTRKLTHLRQSPVYVVRSGVLIGIIGIVYDLHENAMQLINGLRVKGITVIGVISGESNDKLQPVLDKLGVNEYSAAGLSAGEKARLVAGLRGRGQVVAVVSGEPHDMAALTAADVGIMLKSRSSGPVDVLIPECGLEKLGFLFDLSLSCFFKTRQNLAIMQAAHSLGLCLGALRRLTPLKAAKYNTMVTLAVGLSTLLMKTEGFGGNSRPDLWEQGKRPGKSADCQNGDNAETIDKPLLALIKRDGQKLYGAPQTTNQKGKIACDNGWPGLSTREVLLKLSADYQGGLSIEEVNNRLLQFGYNKLAEGKRTSLFNRFVDQLNNFMVQALLGSTAVCFFLGEFGDAVAILTIVVMNAVFGMLQEQKAENALDALKQMTAPRAMILREGHIVQAPAAELVPGDIVFLEQGDGVPADVRLLSVNCFEVEESSLTGESCPVGKKTGAQKHYDLIHECSNMAFMGTMVTRGRATAVVVSTGMSTEMGKIAGLLSGEGTDKTPLQRRLEVIGRSVLKACLTVSGIIAIAGIIRGQPPFAMFLTGVSLAVAAIPEGLPATVTVALAAGVRRMAKKHAIVRRLPGVETLGCTTVICTDKTGTLTKNQQTVQAIYSQGHLWMVSGAGYDPEGDFFEDGRPVYHSLEDGLISTLTAGILCSDARVVPEGDDCTRQAVPAAYRAVADGGWVALGDPLEGALVVAGMKAGLEPDLLRRTFPRLAEIPFDSEQGYMAVACAGGEGESTLYFKGAPEKILSICTRMLEKGRVVPITGDKAKNILEINECLAGKALRVLAMAYRPDEKEPCLDPEKHEKDLIFLGLVGMRDPLRMEVRDAVDRCRRAGIKVAMITGDHHSTAMAIGRELGILGLGRSERVVTGAEIEAMSDEELKVIVGNTRVFARVLPRQKMRLVNAYKGRGEVVAMIGDGANDAPAVRSADIGVAMGRSGTDVTRESSVMIITDDNFSTVVTAIEQGRGIFDNIRKSVRYLLATNTGEVILMFLTVISGLPLPLLPIQLLFLNLLGDGFPALALGLDNPAPDVIEQSPRSPNSKFFDRNYSNKILSRGLSIGITGMGSYIWSLRTGNLSRARTVALATLTMSQLLYALNCRWEKKVKKEQNIIKNEYLTGALGLSALLLAGAIYLPFSKTVFKTIPIGLPDWGVVALGTGLSSSLDHVFEALINIFLPGEQEEKAHAQYSEEEKQKKIPMI